MMLPCTCLENLAETLRCSLSHVVTACLYTPLMHSTLLLCRKETRPFVQHALSICVLTGDHVCKEAAWGICHGLFCLW